MVGRGGARVAVEFANGTVARVRVQKPPVDRRTLAMVVSSSQSNPAIAWLGALQRPITFFSQLFVSSVPSR